MKTIASGILFLLLAHGTSWSQGWQVSPARQELTISPGETETFVVRLSRDDPAGGAGSDEERIRFTVAPGDWDIGRRGEMLFAPPASLPDSACDWLTVSPIDFELGAGSVSPIRVSLSVPDDASPGLYRLGLFFEEHSIIPPHREGTRRLVMRYRLSTLIYVTVPGVSKDVRLREASLDYDPAGRSAVHALIDNPGTAHLRPEHWLEVRDHAGELLFRTDPLPTSVLLPGRELAVNLDVPSDALAALPARLRYVLDAGPELPLQAVTLELPGSGE